MSDPIKCRALASFTVFVSGYGQVHGDPDAKLAEAKSPLVPESQIQQLVDQGFIAAPKGWAGAADEELPPA
jgi:hypothetical protein